MVLYEWNDFASMSLAVLLLVPFGIVLQMEKWSDANREMYNSQNNKNVKLKISFWQGLVHWPADNQWEWQADDEGRSRLDLGEDQQTELHCPHRALGPGKVHGVNGQEGEALWRQVEAAFKGKQPWLQERMKYGCPGQNNLNLIVAAFWPNIFWLWCWNQIYLP